MDREKKEKQNSLLCLFGWVEKWEFYFNVINEMSFSP
jgi:hypothetical protein